MNLMKKIYSLTTLDRAIRKVRSPEKCAGIDGVRPDKESMKEFVKNNLEKIRTELASGRYKPDRILRLHIPKASRKTRPLGIPTVRDRIVQKAIQIVIEPRFERQFLDSSFAFRRKRSTHQAAAKMRDFINEGYTHVVSMDLANCFGTLNHDKLMHHVREQIDDPQVLCLIRSYLSAEVSDSGRIETPQIGVEQGLPLSPLLCNIYLHQLDLEMCRRDYAYVRFADDFRILKKSQAAAESAMESVSKYVERRLKLKVNREKSELISAEADQFVGYSFRRHRGQFRLTIAPKNMKRFRSRLDEIVELGRNDAESGLFTLVWYCVGWIGQYKQCRADDPRRRHVILRAVSSAEQIRQSYAAESKKSLPPMKLGILAPSMRFKASMALVHSFAPDWITQPSKY